MPKTEAGKPAPTAKEEVKQEIEDALAAEKRMGGEEDDPFEVTLFPREGRLIISALDSLASESEREQGVLKELKDYLEDCLKGAEEDKSLEVLGDRWVAVHEGRMIGLRTAIVAVENQLIKREALTKPKASGTGKEGE